MTGKGARMNKTKKTLIWALVIIFTLAAGFGIGYESNRYMSIKDANKSDFISRGPFCEDLVLKYLSEKPALSEVKNPLEGPAVSKYASSTYAYNNLSDDQKGFYDKIYRVILSKQDEDYPKTSVCDDDLGFIAWVDISEFNLTGTSMFEAWLALLYDKPELYYVEGSALYSYIGDDEAYAMIHSVGKYKSRESRQLIENAVDSAVNELNTRCAGLSEPEKAIEVCKFMAEKYNYATDEQDIAVVNTDTENISSLYTNTAVCGGYSKTYAFLAHQVGLETLFITGYVPEGYHAWNYVRADDTWYGVDSTFYDCGFDNYMLGGQEDFSDHIPDSPGLSEDENGACAFGHHLQELSPIGYVPESADNEYSEIENEEEAIEENNTEESVDTKEDNNTDNTGSLTDPDEQDKSDLDNSNKSDNTIEIEETDSNSESEDQAESGENPVENNDYTNLDNNDATISTDNGSTTENNTDNTTVSENTNNTAYMPPNPNQTYYSISAIYVDGFTFEDYYQTGTSYFSNGDSYNAIGYYLSALDLSPNDSSTLKHIADSYYCLFDFADSAPYYKRLYEITGDSGDLMGYGWAIYEGYGGSSNEAREFDSYAKSKGYDIKFYIPDPSEIPDDFWTDICTYFACVSAGN